MEEIYEDNSRKVRKTDMMTVYGTNVLEEVEAEEEEEERRRIEYNEYIFTYHLPFSHTPPRGTS